LPHPYPYVQLQQKVIDPLYESKSDVDIATGIAQKLGYGDYFEGGEEGFIDLIMDHPSLKSYSRESLSDKAMYLNEIPEGSDFPLNFRTPSGKIEIYAEQLVEDGQALPVYLEPIEAPVIPSDHKYPLTFIQGHSRFRTHSSYANVESLLQIEPEPVVEVNSVDAKKRNINTGDLVNVFNERAETILKARVSDSVRPGTVNIMEGWWIEQFENGSVNHLTHDIINPVQNKVYEPNMHMNDVAVEIKKVEDN
ncbi:MAG: dehydrogenase, partial [Candidatus Lokiarchaeota archaeon]|nr:dehydrogenase [Candidatus Lokiarchaeota archaeon]MBD3202581.1 dehydrogenase [Candidatus Lokiarchaeota archaeon]